jgi:hypothetical protein
MDESNTAGPASRPTLPPGEAPLDREKLLAGIENELGATELP